MSIARTIRRPDPPIATSSLSGTIVSPPTIARGAFIALGASIPIATAMDTVLVAVIAVAWVAAGRFRETAAAIRTNPVSLLALLWLSVHLVGATYSIGGPEDIWQAVTKAAVFLLIPVAAVFMRDPAHVRRAHFAFMAAVALTMALSYLRWAGFLPHALPFLKDTGYSPSVVFKYHLTQNLMVAYGSFLFAVYAFAARGRNRVLLGACAALGVINVLFVGDGRTGQVVLLVLVLYFGAWCGGRRGAAVGMVVVFAIGAVAYAVPGSSLHNRIALAVSDFVHWQPGVHAKPSGVTERLEFHKRGMQIVSEHPLVGVGSGGFAVADRERAVAVGLPPARHPHNEYLLKAVELGVIGPLLMLVIFGVQWRKAAALPLREHQAIARGLVLMFAVGSFGTSMLRDHAEALLFVWMSAVLFATLPAGARPRP